MPSSLTNIKNHSDSPLTSQVGQSDDHWPEVVGAMVVYLDLSLLMLSISSNLVPPDVALNKYMYMYYEMVAQMSSY